MTIFEILSTVIGGLGILSIIATLITLRRERVKYEKSQSKQEVDEAVGDAKTINSLNIKILETNSLQDIEIEKIKTDAETTKSNVAELYVWKETLPDKIDEKIDKMEKKIIGALQLYLDPIKEAVGKITTSVERISHEHARNHYVDRV